MFLRNGVDIIEISRIERALQREAFLNKCFSQDEISFLKSRGAAMAQSAAASFAAKEAFSKALGTGVRGFSLPQIEVLRDAFGAPYLRLSGGALQQAQKQGLQFTVSLSHDRERAIAFVTAYSV